MCKHPEMSASTREMSLCAEGLRWYREALEMGTASGDVPECLTRYGLLRPLPGVRNSFVPVPPRIAQSEFSRPIERDIEQRQRTLEALHSSFLTAEVVYRKVQHRSELPIESLRGESVIAEALRLAVGSVKEELLTAQPGGGRAPALLAEALPRDLDLVRHGVQQRTLYQHSVRSHRPTLAYIEQVVSAGAQVRTLDEIFERVIICDRSIAFIPGIPERKNAALAIRHPGALKFLAKAFEHMWERAEPVSMVTEQHRPDLLGNSVRKTMVRLVVTGHTDQAIAARLGVSARTVTTHIKKISEALGSRSRAELGYLISQRRLLEPESSLPDETAHHGHTAR